MERERTLPQIIFSCVVDSIMYLCIHIYIYIYILDLLPTASPIYSLVKGGWMAKIGMGMTGRHRVRNGEENGAGE